MNQEPNRNGKETDRLRSKRGARHHGGKLANSPPPRRQDAPIQDITVVALGTADSLAQDDFVANDAALRRLARSLECRYSLTDAESILQDATLGLLRTRPLRGEHFACLLRLRVRCRAIDAYRSQRRRQTCERRWMRELAALGSDETVKPFPAEEFAPLKDALQRLDEIDRKIIQWRYWDELSLIAIAQLLHFLPSTVRGRLRRALLSLRTRLASSRGRA